MTAADHLAVILVCLVVPAALSTSAGCVAFFRKRKSLGIWLAAGGLGFVISATTLFFWVLFASVDECEKQPLNPGDDCFGPGIILLPVVPLFFSLPTFVATWGVYLLRAFFARKSMRKSDATLATP